MAQRLGSQILDRAKHVSLVIGPDGYRDLPALIESARAGIRTTSTEFDLEEHYEDFTPRRFPGVKAWIPVQRGCDYRCTYCIVPTTRGPERSRQLHEVMRETESVVASGISEIVLIGQTVNSYFDGTHDFADLLREVGGVPGVRRLRFTSPHPNDFSERVIRAMVETESVCEHVHLPMQSGSTRTLKRMLRRYTRERYLECVDELRAAIPDVALTTDVIVGFPGETAEDFEETLSAVRAVGFEEAYTFKFSPRDGTPATRFPASETVSDDIASDRLARLIATVRAGSRERNLKLLGERREVLVEKAARRGSLLQSRTRDFKTVMIPGDASLIGQYLTVELTGTTGSTFIGQAVHPRMALPLAV
ncbi:MAG: MiaB/RimO family radical SAM methylthiotransferase [Steroidobacteraceae bacterium]|nr:MiaB/RimO family radical SAM methylthiotransferase [Steroidobacteraceae bacterium]